MGTESAWSPGFCATSQPGPPGLSLQKLEFLQRAHICRRGSACKRVLHARSVSVHRFHSKHFLEVASGRAFLPATIGSGICSTRRETNVPPVLPRYPDAVRNRTGSTTSATEPAPSINDAASLGLLHGRRSAEPSDATTDKHPQLCPVCGRESVNQCACCDQDFCSNHIYFCVECGAQYCSDCSDAHHADGHWGDSDTAAELAHAQRLGGGRARDLRDRSPSGAPFDQSNSQPSLTLLLTPFVSLLALVLRRCVVIQPEACL